MKKIHFFILFLIIINTVNLGCIQQEEKKDQPYFKYLIELIPTDDSYFEIIVPIILNENDLNISPIMNEISIIGNGNYEYNDTIFGKALKISGNGEIILINEGKEKMPYGWLNLLYDSDDDGITIDETNDVKYWVSANFSNSNNIHIKMYSNIYHSKKENKMYISTFEDDLINGWQKIDGNKIIKRK